MFRFFRTPSRDQDAVAVAFSPSGLILYVATSASVTALDSDGNSAYNWKSSVSDDDLSDITVSPDGLSVRYYCGVDVLPTLHVGRLGYPLPCQRPQNYSRDTTCYSHAFRNGGNGAKPVVPAIKPSGRRSRMISRYRWRHKISSSVRPTLVCIFYTTRARP